MSNSIWKSFVGAIAAVTLASHATALAQAPRKVVIAHGSQQVEITHPGLYLGGVLGFAQQEGIELAAQTTQGSQQALQLLAAGRADFAQVTTETVINAKDQGVNARIVYSAVNHYNSQIAALADGPVREVKDFKGKQIGVFSLVERQRSLPQGSAEGSRSRSREGRHDGPDGCRRPGAAGPELRDGRRPQPMGRRVRGVREPRREAQDLHLQGVVDRTWPRARNHRRIHPPESGDRRQGRPDLRQGRGLRDGEPGSHRAGLLEGPAAEPAARSQRQGAQGAAAHPPGRAARHARGRSAATSVGAGTTRPAWRILQKYLVDNGARKTIVPDNELFTNAFVDEYNTFDAAAIRAMAGSYKP